MVAEKAVEKAKKVASKDSVTKGLSKVKEFARKGAVGTSLGATVGYGIGSATGSIKGIRNAQGDAYEKGKMSKSAGLKDKATKALALAKKNKANIAMSLGAGAVVGRGMHVMGDRLTRKTINSVGAKGIRDRENGKG